MLCHREISSFYTASALPAAPLFRPKMEISHAPRGDDQTYAFPSSLRMGLMENRDQILGNKSRSIAGMLAAQTFHIDMNLNPAPHLFTLKPTEQLSNEEILL
jgi:hypothetical protein